MKIALVFDLLFLPALLPVSITHKSRYCYSVNLMTASVPLLVEALGLCPIHSDGDNHFSAVYAQIAFLFAARLEFGYSIEIGH
jgi:hypothetical protein